MPTVLLPASAAAFAPRSSPNVVLNKVEPWLTATLKRVNRVKRPLNNVNQHTRCLTETLSSPNAIWTLCSIMFPKAPDAELRKDDNPLVEALFNYQMVHIEAYVVHVDMVSQNEVAFKLTPETIEALVEFHKDVYSVDTAASTWNWSEKDAQLKKLQEEFVQAANKFVYRTNVQALEGLEEDGAGELLCGRGEEAKAAIASLFVPLLPPPPRVVDVLRPVPLLPSSTLPDAWWHSQMEQPAPIEPWKVIPSSPSPASSGDSNPNMWSGLSMSDMQLPSPAPSYSQPYTTSPYSTSEYYCAPTTAALTALPLPSMLVQPCSTAAGMAGFGWTDRYQDFALPYGTTM
ncbi:hypothetical protein DTO164E3_5157 [Paecilomyces variotii]|nr:hypothetical protein DTO164E3_5157 [Paecilomyces variotii]KAJ9200875.1 hypothetical protein DTO032I3_4349 [Paecilomyces variotii]KAJ9221234.1 hypothetical protein DTO169C6_6370 [Paecilomyces variotii]KAJ9231668.1 hypothetical protein DTO169E5_7827 [Paecilomyces variotii]KAJ9249030.1 hypothetical protein DTO207G8_6957 [Paecilomyces variotii]